MVIHTTNDITPRCIKESANHPTQCIDISYAGLEFDTLPFSESKHFIDLLMRHASPLFFGKGDPLAKFSLMSSSTS